MRKKEPTFEVGDRIYIVDDDTAIGSANKKMESLRSDHSKRVIRDITSNIRLDYTRDTALKNKVNKTYIIISRQNYGTQLKGAETYIIADEKTRRPVIPYGVYGFCIKKISEYAVDLI